MAWYLKKAFKIGPLLRMNLSKSGVGFSFGVKGARIGIGPRGKYVALGRRGIYFRQSLNHSVADGSVPLIRPTHTGYYCTQCGSPLTPGNQFCTQCGAQQVSQNSASTMESDGNHDHHLHWFIIGAAILLVIFVVGKLMP
jgi:hypothetical protein